MKDEDMVIEDTIWEAIERCVEGGYQHLYVEKEQMYDMLASIKLTEEIVEAVKKRKEWVEGER